MCECGCYGNDLKYSLAAPGGAFYVLTFSGACEDCDAPSGVAVELIELTHPLFDEYRRGEFLLGPLPWEKWPDGKGAAVITGLTKQQFIEAMSKHLVGVCSDEMGDDGTIDQDGADVIAEEMYADAQKQPQLLASTTP